MALVFQEGNKPADYLPGLSSKHVHFAVGFAMECDRLPARIFDDSSIPPLFIRLGYLEWIVEAEHYDE